MFIKMILEFGKKSSKIIGSNRRMPIKPTTKGIKLRALTARNIYDYKGVGRVYPQLINGYTSFSKVLKIPPNH